MNVFCKNTLFFAFVLYCLSIFNSLNAQSHCSDLYGCQEEQAPGFEYKEETKTKLNLNKDEVPSHCSELYGCQNEQAAGFEYSNEIREEQSPEFKYSNEIDVLQNTNKELSSYTDNEKLKLLRYWYAKEMYVYMSPIFALSFSKEEIELMAKLETMDCLQHALNLSEKNWSYSDKITELKDLCGNAKWKVSDHQNLVDLILNRNFFYPHSKKENYNKISKVLFNYPDTINACERSIYDLAPSKRPNHENAKYIKKFYSQENKRANNINWCLQRIVDGRYKIK